MRRSLYIIFFLILVVCGNAQPNQYKLIAYYTGRGDAVRQFEIDKLTHIIYSFLAVRNDSLQFHDSVQENNCRQLLALKKEYPALKIMVSFGGWGGCADCSARFSDPQRRKIFVQSVKELFERTGIDGLDIDWEYPSIEGYPGHRYDSSDRKNFTALVTELRAALGKKTILSFAAGGFDHFLEASVDWKAVMKQMDFVNLMTYDLVGGYATVTGHHTPVDGKQTGEQSLTRCVNWLLDHKVPSRKLIAGAAFYGRVWGNVPDTNQGLYQPGHFLRGVAFRDLDTYLSEHPGFQYHWDEAARAPFYYNPQEHLFLTLDDRSSAETKCDFVKMKNLGGVMFWEMSQDLPRNGLIAALAAGLFP